MEADNESTYLKQVHLFAGLSDDDIQELASVVKRRAFRSG